MVDVLDMPDSAFGYVPTPAIVGPIEFPMPPQVYAELGGHLGTVKPLEAVLKERGTGERERMTEWNAATTWPLSPIKKAGFRCTPTTLHGPAYIGRGGWRERDGSFGCVLGGVGTQHT